MATAAHRNTPSGILTLLGAFAGVCALFALAVTILEWRVEDARSRWPVVSATVERADVMIDQRASGNAAATTRLRYRVRYDAGGAAIASTITTRVAQSDEEGARLRAWSSQHRSGRTVDVRYDPANPAQATFASGEVPGEGSRTRSNLTLLTIAAIACVVLLVAAQVVRAHEAHLADPAIDPARGGLAIGIACALAGLVPLGAALYGAWHAGRALTAEDLIAIPACLLFVVAGVMLALPPHRDAARRVLGTLLVTLFAATLDLIAFGPGERHFGGGISLGPLGLGIAPGETFGRIAFGVVAVMLDAWALASWVAWARRAAASRSPSP